jgi:uncharacterized protein (TIGR02145 family)
MKNVILVLFVFFVCGCSTPNDSNNSTSNTVPIAPTKLNGTFFSDTQVNLTWTDNSSNETGFKIERTTGDGIWSVIGTVKADTISFSDVGLALNTTYIYRVYSFNAIGNSVNYSNIDTFQTKSIFVFVDSVTDIDGNVYSTFQFGLKNWMQKNLNVSKYRNGDIIPQISNPTEWIKATTGAWCYYDNKTENGVIYGKLYNRYAVSDPRGLAPNGWHIPSYSEWRYLTTGGGNIQNVGGKMKEIGNSHWQTPNTGATNEFGFTALPGGCRNNVEGSFSGIGTTGFWKSYAYDPLLESSSTYTCWLVYNSENAYLTTSKISGFSVRCVQD